MDYLSDKNIAYWRNRRDTSMLFVRSALLLSSLFILTAGCSNMSYLQKGEKLYTGADVTVEEGKDLPDIDLLEEQLESIVRPEPNSEFLGFIRFKLWLYNVGIFKESMGEPPVLMNSVFPERITAKMRTLIENKGYFSPEIRYTVNEEEQSADIVYSVIVQPPYMIRSVSVPASSIPLTDTIRTLMEGTLLTAGSQYDMDKLKLERERIDAALKEKGYFHFSADDLVFHADSSFGNRSIDLSLQLKKDISPEALRRYMIGTVTIRSGYTFDGDTVTGPPADSQRIGALYFIDSDGEFTPDVLIRSIYLRNGEVYSRTEHERTLQRLMSLGVFKFVNIRFDEGDSAGIPRLDLTVFLTPLLINSIQFELQGVSKSNNLAGPVFEASFRNKNLFGGAELLKLSVNAGFEMPVSSGQSGGNSIELGARAELELPKFVMLFVEQNTSGLFVPKTRTAVGFHLLHRLEYYQMFSIDASFGYVWRPSARMEHILNPFAVTFAHLTEATEKFNALLNANPLLRKSFEEQFIIGENYSFTYNDQFEQDRKNHLYLKAGIDLSGNILQLVQSLYLDHPASPEDPYRLWGTVYAQYYKFDVDARGYYNSIDQSSSLAGRVIAGIGIAHGNSRALPYVKQFSSGGSSSIRAFIARGLGPGSYAKPAGDGGDQFIDQTGDIKLEANLEYRFPIVSILKGALFVDAGNIWLLNSDPNRPGGMFSGKTFFKEMAVGAGIGSRIDLSFFVIRLDVAVPMRIPSLPEQERWVYSKIAFGDQSWRKNNLLFNIAIGYPF